MPRVITAAEYLDRAERVLRIATLAGQAQDQRQLFRVIGHYLRLAGEANPDDDERTRIASLRAEIEDRLPDRS
jgi:hypothetical protein